MQSDRVKDILTRRKQLELDIAAATTPETPLPPLPHEIEQARRLELLSKVRETRARLMINKGEVKDGNPNKVYIWVNQKEDRRTFFEGLGYQLCTDPNVKTRWRKEDGTHRRGDLILYEIDRELHEIMQLDSQIRAVEQMASSKDSFLEFATGANVRVFQPGG